MPDRGRALTIDSGWREVTDTALGFVARFLAPRGLAGEAGTAEPAFGEGRSQVPTLV